MTQDTPRRGLVRCGVSARPAGAARAVAVAVALLASALGVSSPAAAQAQPFSDTSEDAFYSDAVNALADGGLFEGTECAPGMLCPGEPIDRKTMAVWTVRALDSQNPAPITNSRFSDVTDGSFHAPFIERMAELGVTKGCGDGTFCPDDTVTRYQMAVFLTRAFNLEPGPDPGFTDVTPSAWYYNDVAALAASAITAGCGNGTFCPNQHTTRGQMATFLARATGLVDLPQPPTPAPTYTAITAGGWGSFGQADAAGGHSCALRTDNTITCWGNNDSGAGRRARRPIHRHHRRRQPLLRPANRQHHHMLGQQRLRGRPTRPTANTPPSPPAASHSCALRTDNTITCWGNNNYGAGRRARRPIQRHHRRRRATLAPCEPTTPSHAGATTTGGRPTRPTANTPPSPPAAATLAPCEPTTPSHAGATTKTGQADAPDGQYTAITAGGFHSCALRTDNTITCWGNNDSGQADAPDGQYTAITAGGSHSCALRTDNTITCWGWNDYGAGRRARRPIHRHHRRPRPLLRPANRQHHHMLGQTTGMGQTDAPDGQYTAITAGTWEHSCALRTDNTITCWGSNDWGQADAPDGQYTAITAGSGHSCALRTDNTITCWGNNNSGQADAPDGQYTAITAGGEHSCALRTDNTITCWGNNGLGAGRRARRPIHRHHRRHLPLLRPANRQHHHMLGQQQLGAGRRARRPIHRHHRRRIALLRPANRQHHHMLGQQRLRPTRPTANTAPSPPAATTLAPCEPTTPSHAGRCCLMGSTGWPAAVNGPPSGRRPGHRLHLCSSGPNGCANPTAATSPAGPSPTM